MILKILAIWFIVVLQFVFFNLFPIGLSGLNLILIVSLILVFFDKTKWALVTIVLGTVLIDYISGYDFGIWPIAMFLSLGLVHYFKKYIPKKTDFFFVLFTIVTILIFNIIYILSSGILNGFHFSSWWLLQLLYSLVFNSIVGFIIYKIYYRYLYHKTEYSY